MVRNPLDDSIPEPNTGCWLYLKGWDKDGYGRASYEGKRVKAHRLSFRLHYGREAVGVVMHTCDQPCCVNPHHLRDASQRDNILDMVAKGRHFSPKRGVTHCKHGHPFTSENTYTYKRPWGMVRQCKECTKARSRSRG